MRLPADQRVTAINMLEELILDIQLYLRKKMISQCLRNILDSNGKDILKSNDLFLPIPHSKTISILPLSVFDG